MNALEQIRESFSHTPDTDDEAVKEKIADLKQKRSNLLPFEEDIRTDLNKQIDDLENSLSIERDYPVLDMSFMGEVTPHTDCGVTVDLPRFVCIDIMKKSQTAKIVWKLGPYWLQSDMQTSSNMLLRSEAHAVMPR